MNQILSEYSTWDETALSACTQNMQHGLIVRSRDKARVTPFMQYYRFYMSQYNLCTSLNANIPMPFLNILYTMLDSFQSLAQHLEVLEIDLLLPSKPLNDLLCIWIL